ncbi:NAD-dependent epimerase/dehydratase family protein [Saccharopolyspora erythraea]|uniref:NAD-dependent epimerase/dehydratase family protein n=1 Tax=Saccharopolyspora erythraea TaxID=1836 RepID=UPI002012FA29|nr:NAD(P)-dependent oxidoreductase [Saccharopolyspora erythraea]
MRVAVTGANGRIGRVVVDALVRDGHEVVAIDRSLPQSRAGVEAVAADVTDFDAVRDALEDCRGLAHLAAVPSPWHDVGHVVHNTNVTAGFNALSAAVEAGIWKVCQASSINAVGGAFSRRARYDYFPVDETHPTYNEDPYSLSKWIAEAQADSFARRYAQLTVSSLRIHGAVPDRDAARVSDPGDAIAVNHLWGYVRLDAIAQAFVLALRAEWRGHEVFNIVAPDTAVDVGSRALAAEYYPGVPIRADMVGRDGFYDCSKARRVLGWTHEPGNANG